MPTMTCTSAIERFLAIDDTCLTTYLPYDVCHQHTLTLWFTFARINICSPTNSSTILSHDFPLEHCTSNTTSHTVVETTPLNPQLPHMIGNQHKSSRIYHTHVLDVEELIFEELSIGIYIYIYIYVFIYIYIGRI